MEVTMIKKMMAGMLIGAMGLGSLAAADILPPLS